MELSLIERQRLPRIQIERGHGLYLYDATLSYVKKFPISVDLILSRLSTEI